MASTYPGLISVSEFGNRFASRYYSKLQDNPHLFPLLYSDESTRVQIDGVMTDTAITKRGIGVLAGPLFYNKIDLKTVNTIQSCDGIILVMTSGTATDVAGLKRPFVETFLLAPKCSGYFVLNDIFQFIDGQNAFELHHAPISSGNIYPPHQSPVLSEDNHDNRLNPYSSVPTSSLPVPSAEDDILQFINGEIVFEPHHVPISSGNIYPLLQAPVLSEDNHDSRLNPSSSLPVPSVSDNVFEEEVRNNLSLVNLEDDPVEHQEQRDSAKEVVVENSPREETATMSQGGANAVGDPPAAALENLVQVPVKITYASMVRRPKSQFSPSVAAQPSAQQPNAGLSVTPASRGREAQELLGVGQRQPKRICVRNLPLGITGAEIFQLFKNFGRIESSSVDIMPRSETAHACTAYLNFQEFVGAQNAIKASPIQFAGRKVYIEEAKQRSKGIDSEGWGWMR